jgi:hypothetical protein
VSGCRGTSDQQRHFRRPTASESEIVHDHVRLRQDEIVAITHSAICIGARHVLELDTTDDGDYGGSSCRECVGEHLLPTPQSWGFGRPGPPVPAPCTGNRHPDLFCHLTPGQALVTEFPDLLCGRRVSRSTAATHGDSCAAKLMAHRGRRDPQLRTYLAQGLTLGVQVGCTRNVHRGSVTSLSRIGFSPNQGVGARV